MGMPSGGCEVNVEGEGPITKQCTGSSIEVLDCSPGLQMLAYGLNYLS